MAEIVLFHHVLGLTPGVEGIAGSLREHGHTVTVPDLFEGRTFAEIEDGMEHFEQLGFAVLLERARGATAELPDELVYMGISMGAIPAEFLTMTRPGARGAVLAESAVPVEAFVALEPGLEWPEDVPFQIHGMDRDPVFAGEGDLETAREMVGSLPDGQLFTYPGNVHLFCDASLGGYDPGATSLMLERVREFLERIDGSG